MPANAVFPTHVDFTWLGSQSIWTFTIVLSKCFICPRGWRQPGLTVFPIYWIFILLFKLEIIILHCRVWNNTMIFSLALFFTNTLTTDNCLWIAPPLWANSASYHDNARIKGLFFWLLPAEKTAGWIPLYRINPEFTN